MDALLPRISVVAAVPSSDVRWRLLAHPYFTGALLVLALNDHVLKQAVPGPATGKLSAAAGVFVATVAMTALTARPRLSVSAVGLGFTAIKLSPAAAQLVAPLLGGVTRQDPTDLLALGILPSGYRFSRRWFPRTTEPSITLMATSLLSGRSRSLPFRRRAVSVRPLSMPS